MLDTNSNFYLTDYVFNIINVFIIMNLLVYPYFIIVLDLLVEYILDFLVLIRIT